MKTPILPFIYSYFNACRSVRRFPSKKVLKSWQEKQVQRHLHWLRGHSPYYAQRLKRVNISDWRQLETVSKSEMMENFDRINTASLKKEKLLNFALANEESRDFGKEVGRFTVGLSSGTSGNKGLFVVSEKERSCWAGYILARMLPRPLWHKQRIALFLRSGGPLYQSTGGVRIQFQYFDIFKSLDEHLDALQEYQPTLIVGPPSVLKFLAEKISADKLLIKPEKIVSVAEVLDPIDQIRIENAFGFPIHQVYQATEGCIASTCSHGTLHLHEDLMCIEKEVVDLSFNRFVPIITDFSRTTQPIVRYRLDDILVEKKTPCPCGSIFTQLESIEGRCDDTLVFESKDKNTCVAIYPDFFRRCVAFSSNQIFEYRIVQTNFDQLLIEFSSLSKERERIKKKIYKELVQLFTQKNVAIPDISYSLWKPHPVHQKMRRVFRKFDIYE
ncbi:MAG: hypothetical protein SNF33_01985 [Candidatus Algichlamydia australiensis]|nr:hypothetical protein [Chlamydiales bacterium]